MVQRIFSIRVLGPEEPLTGVIGTTFDEEWTVITTAHYEWLKACADIVTLPVRGD